jgi:hypothetical protein
VKSRGVSRTTPTVIIYLSLIVMAVSRFAYVRDFELPDPLLPGTFIILRIDGHAFQKYSLIIIILYHLIPTPTDSPMSITSQSLTTSAASSLWIMLPYLS